MRTLESDNQPGDILSAIRRRVEQTATWPPPELEQQWLKIEAHRRQYTNDSAEKWQHKSEWHNSEEKRAIFTPVPLAKDMARLSSQLLFSETPRFTLEKSQEELDELVKANMLPSMLQEAGENVAIEGTGGLRVFRDDESLEDTPIIEYVPGDQVIWDVRHGRFVVGGAVIITRLVYRGSGFPASQQPNAPQVSASGAVSGTQGRAYDVYRLIEYHETGKVSRTLYKGAYRALGAKVSLDDLAEFSGLEEEEQTVEGVCTLLMWRNIPNGASDLDGLEALLERVDEGYSYGVDKLRKSIPKVFADRSLADDAGHVDLTGVVLTGDGTLPPELGESATKTVETAQPGLEADAHIRMIEHLMNSALEMAGYSRATWGRDDGGSADSGKALKLRQVRTLMTRNGKERMAVDAIRKALSVAMLWQVGSGELKDYEPEVELGDGLPNDELETAQMLQLLTTSESASTRERVRMLRPDWDEQSVDEEVELIDNSKSGPEVKMPELSLDGLEDEEGGDSVSGSELGPEDRRLAADDQANQ